MALEVTVVVGVVVCEVVPVVEGELVMVEVTDVVAEVVGELVGVVISQASKVPPCKYDTIAAFMTAADAVQSAALCAAITLPN